MYSLPFSVTELGVGNKIIHKLKLTTTFAVILRTNKMVHKKGRHCVVPLLSRKIDLCYPEHSDVVCNGLFRSLVPLVKGVSTSDFRWPRCKVLLQVFFGHGKRCCLKLGWRLGKH